MYASHSPGSGRALISQPATTAVRNRRARLGALGRAATAILDANSELKTLDDFIPVAGNAQLAQELYEFKKTCPQTSEKSSSSGYALSLG
ncbi:hypothetical protein AURDEDRAFT_178732 [Auricularia subglabra TFB-10046 SS5]|uniref:Uncharacterized protein n=1 Tax=Auricularia subglabra (strain TFB-10046 / SS5) TaxID=717982 RepID=J0WIW7_AURST|nr:hypothetical protein AURDEDRAFT_178732 [Auricularia subglabra TFB-10046 SS5]